MLYGAAPLKCPGGLFAGFKECREKPEKKTGCKIISFCVHLLNAADFGGGVYFAAIAAKKVNPVPRISGGQKDIASAV